MKPIREENMYELDPKNNKYAIIVFFYTIKIFSNLK
jgi:hypothetical protein